MRITHQNFAIITAVWVVVGGDPSPTWAQGEPDETPAETEADLGEAVVPGDPDDNSLFLDPDLVGSEVIEIWAERPEKPYERDTDLRFTGEELAELGATDLSEALELLPDLYVRAAGRGGRQIDIRGARKGSVKILIDGMSVADPYYGNFDLSSIPVTDIEQIRVSSSPASPIDGTGGPGGVIEVHTRDAVGPEEIRVRAEGSSLPGMTASSTARTMLSDDVAARASISALVGSRDYQLQAPGGLLLLDEDRRQTVGAARVEYRRGDRRAALDLWMQHQAYVVPPAEDFMSDLLVIDGEGHGRVGLTYDDIRGRWQFQGRAYYQLLSRRSTVYEDAELQSQLRQEDLSARRSGTSLLVNRPLTDSLALVSALNVEHDSAEVDDFSGTTTIGTVSVLQGASGVHYRRGPLEAQAAVGAAAPVGIDANPWPEAKLSGELAVARPLTVKAEAGHKGRVPSLRERFRTDIGNPALGPEKVYFVEVGPVITPHRHLRLSLRTYARRTSGLIRFDSGQMELVNVENASIRGLEAEVEVAPEAPVSGGAFYSYADIYSELLGHNALDFFPRSRAAAYLALRRGSRYGGRATARRIGEQDDRGEPLPAYTTLDLSAYGRVGDSALFNLRVVNATGTLYPQRAGVLAPGRTFFLSLQRHWD